MPVITQGKDGTPASGHQGSGSRSVVVLLCDILDRSLDLPRPVSLSAHWSPEVRDGGEFEHGLSPACPSLTLSLVALERTLWVCPSPAPTVRLSFQELKAREIFLLVLSQAFSQNYRLTGVL